MRREETRLTSRGLWDPRSTANPQAAAGRRDRAAEAGGRPSAQEWARRFEWDQRRNLGRRRRAVLPPRTYGLSRRFEPDFDLANPPVELRVGGVVAEHVIRC